jgi:hypothetical protein
MGLAVDDDDSPSPPPSSPPPTWSHHHQMTGIGGPLGGSPMNLSGSPPNPNLGGISSSLFNLTAAAAAAANFPLQKCSQQVQNQRNNFPAAWHSLAINRKRQFDVASLLAPEKDHSSRAHRTRTISPSSCKSDEQGHIEHNNTSSPSPPCSTVRIKRQKLFEKSGSGETSDSEHHSDEEGDIEVAEDNEEKIISGRRAIERDEDGKDVLEGNSSNRSDEDETKPVGQDGNVSSNDEDDGYCHHRTRLPSDHNLMNPPMMIRFPGGGSGPNSPQNMMMNGGGHFLHQNAGSHPHSHHHNHHHGSFSQSNIPHGVMSPLDFIQAQQFIHQQQQQQQQGNNSNHLRQQQQDFPFGPHGLQQNPSLASLMFLSSKYHEITSNILNASGMNNNNNNNINSSKRSPQ